MSSKTAKKTGTGGSPERTPLFVFKSALVKGDNDNLKQACEALCEDLGKQTTTFNGLLDACFGMHNSRTARTMDGGWVGKSSRPARIMELLTSDPRVEWNIFNALRHFSQSPNRDGFAVDKLILPIRTEEYLSGDPPAEVERIATDNSKRLYEYFFFASTRPQAAPPATVGSSSNNSSSTSSSSSSTSGALASKTNFTRLPFLVSHLDFFLYIFFYWAVCPKSVTLTSSRYGFGW